MFFFFKEILVLNVKSIDPDKSAASDLGLTVCQGPFYGTLEKKG